MEPLVWVSDSRRRGMRIYRGESEILYDILFVASRAGSDGIRRTRLLQLANLNSRSSRHYLKLLIDSGALRERDDGKLAITGKGRLMLHLLGMLNALLSGAASLRIEEICGRLAGDGLKCRSGASVYDVLVEAPSGARAGLLSVPASDPAVSLTGLACLAYSIHPVNVVIIAWSEGGPAPVAVTPPDRPFEAYAVALDERVVERTLRETLRRSAPSVARD